MTHVYGDFDNVFYHDFDKVRGKNIIFLNLKELAEEIYSKHLEIKKITIQKIFPNTLSFTIDRRKELAQIEYNHFFYSIDEEGTIFFSSKERRPLPILIGWHSPIEVGSKIEPPVVQSFIPIISALQESDIMVESIEYHNDDFIGMNLSNNVEIISSTKSNSPTTMASLQMMFRGFRIERKFPKAIDVRFQKPIITY